MKKAEIIIQDTIAGWLTQDENGYQFTYDCLPQYQYAGTGKQNFAVASRCFSQ